MTTNFLVNLQNSINTGFINSEIESFKNLQPKILINDKTAEKKVLSSIIENLLQCNEFTFTVAFLTSGGVKSLHNTFKDLEERNIKGNIIISDYSTFTQPEAMRKLCKFKNIKTYFLRDKKYHGKSFLFKNNNKYNLIIGSSNLTQDALSTNLEINLQVTASDKSKIIHEITSLNKKYIDYSVKVDGGVIDEYEKYYEEVNSRTFKIKSDFQTEAFIYHPNSMQSEAIENLENLRNQNKNKAIVISATGTGKTVMSAFDAQVADAKKLLFIVHRRNIALKAQETFKNIFKNTRTFGIFSGDTREINKDFIFSTVQTINNPDHMRNFKPDFFDYIIIDETHRAGGETYKRILNYFRPKFLLGMTATPERTDGFDIFTHFDHNIGYEIRLNRALDEGLLSPFHYFGVTDITVDGRILDENSDFNILLSDERVNRIIEKVKEFDCDNGNVRGLMFCSRVEEAENLSIKLNERGLKTKALSGNNSEDERAEAIRLLESEIRDEKLDYLLTVDIFNEGIDIPKINQIVMLRPTQSAIIFVQQLGRGLRKIDSKEYLTVIDFIGNYQNNYMIPIALFGDTSYDKDTLRRLLSHGSSLISGASTINFDRISREQIFESINSQNLQIKKDLDKDYRLLKYKIGRIPMMVDFQNNGLRDPYQYVDRFKSYSNYLNTIEDNHVKFNSHIQRLLEYFSKYINDGKRLYESLILKNLIDNDVYSLTKFKNDLFELTSISVSDKDIKSTVHNLNLLFITEKSNKKIYPVGELYSYSNVNLIKGNFVKQTTLKEALENLDFRKFISDSVHFSINAYLKSFKKENFLNGFLRYEKYKRRHIHRILNWDTNPVAQNVGGYKVSEDLTNCPIFVTYEKKEDISDSTKYEDQFIDPFTFSWMTKSRRNLNSPEVKTIYNQENNNIQIPLFIKKSDNEGQEYYFIGNLRAIKNSFEEVKMKSDNGEVTVVKIDFKIDKEVDQYLYKYITSS